MTMTMAMGNISTADASAMIQHHHGAPYGGIPDGVLTPAELEGLCLQAVDMDDLRDLLQQELHKKQND